MTLKQSIVGLVHDFEAAYPQGAATLYLLGFLLLVILVVLL